ncbi:rRNA maturation RNase YbeY [Tropicimonas isoalkanivorans]|uniref:Endoribonuclease YbeY n=1 Tax=Tropicimonas isoalkanivorans TaxID=441112 RepID=A0A1I1III1_9RHOB|nr:rRNA maturation RNase YbeY [Tropicimonas isoalkanivorans]SFC36057.1 probable rRNA maturation factor [Tropicimonas isoalkanivorans]
MTDNVDVVIEAPQWEDVGLHALAEKAVLATLRHLRLPDDCQCSLLATDDARITVLNADFRAKEAATNVLSWPAEDLAADTPGGPPALPEADFPGEPPFLGDIALAWETCRAEADCAEKPLNAHVTHLIVHGLLHLLGYDHICDEDADLMERLEIEILGELGFPDPY